MGKISWRSDRLPTPVFWGFSGGLAGKESVCNVGYMGSILELGRSPGGRHGNALQYSCLKNPHDRGDCLATVHGIAKSRTQLSDFHFTHMHYYTIGFIIDTNWPHGSSHLIGFGKVYI